MAEPRRPDRHKSDSPTCADDAASAETPVKRGANAPDQTMDIRADFKPGPATEQITGNLPPPSPARPDMTMDLESIQALPPPPARTDMTMDLQSIPALSSQPNRSPTGSGAADHTQDLSQPDSKAIAGKPPAQVPGYEIISELGRGGMGVVYKARQKTLKRVVALKMILSGSHASALDLARFRIEAEAVARLQHPNIVQVYEIGEHDGNPYYSLEFVDGGALADQLDGTPLLPGEAAVKIETLARAMYVAHQNGIIHRDLKPGNVMVTSDGVLKIMDFGLAKRLEDKSHQTRTGAIMGTPSYMAPEQARGDVKDIGPAADIYSLGAMLYELLTGRPPFVAATVLDTITQVVSVEPVPPTRFHAQVARDLETICLKCLNKTPNRRYPTAEELAADLRRFLNGEPIHARPVSRAEKLIKWVKRRPAAAALIGVSAAAAMALAAMGIWWYNTKLENAENQARVAQQELRENQRLEGLKLDARQLLVQGQARAEASDWKNAKLLFSNALAKVGGEPGLAELHGEASQQLQLATDRLAQSERQEEAQANYRRFVKLHDDALFHILQVSGVDVGADLKAARDRATAALGIYGISATGDAVEHVKLDSLEPPETLRLEFLEEAARARIRMGCAELLMILARVEAEPLPNEKAEDIRQRLTQAIRLLDRATQFHPPTQAYHLRRAEYLALSDDKEQAEREREKARGIQAETAFDFFWLGDAHYQQNELAGALRAFESALQREPDHFWAMYFTAVCQVKLDRAAEAKSSLTACLGKRPAFVWIYLLRGVAHRELNQFDDAWMDFAKAAKLLESQPDPIARYGLLVNRAGVGIRHGEPEKLAVAVADLKAAIELQPEGYQAYVNLARAYQKQKQLAAAIEQIDMAISRTPGVFIRFRERGRLHLENGDLKLAKADFERSIGLQAADSPAVAEDWAEIGRIRHRDKQYREAVQAYDAAVKAMPGYAVAYRLRGEALLELNKHSEAIQSFTKYLENRESGKSEPGGGKVEADVYRARGLARAKIGEYHGAMEDYTRALELDRDSSQMYTRRGWAYLLSAQKLALVDFEKAIEHNPENGDAYNGRAYVKALMGQYRDATADAEKAIKCGPESFELVYNAACVYAQSAGKANADASAPDRTDLTTRYQERAVELLRKALAVLPQAQRATYWQKVIQPDEALNPIRNCRPFTQLQAEFTPGEK